LNTWNDGWVLERKEHAGTGSLEDSEFVEWTALEMDFPGGNLVGRMTHDDVGQSGLPCTIPPHDDMDFATANREVESLDDSCTIDAHMEIFNA
jgi:hypothetical protein